MHIPNHMLNNNSVPFTTGIASAVCITGATYLAIKSKEKPLPLKCAAITSLIFALQMMNFPIQNGTSGHFLGTTLALLLLGTPFGIISIALLLTVQCLIFADGGLSVLGTNIFNMAIIGAIPAFVLNYIFKSYKNINFIQKSGLIFLGSWFSIILAAFACSLELHFSNTIHLSKVLPAMIGVHSIIGIFEGIITIVLYSLLFSEKVQTSKRLSIGIPLISALIVGFILSPFASSFPDGLEWVAEKYNFLHEQAPSFVSPFADYTIPFIKNKILSTGISGLIGVVITFLFVFVVGKFLFLQKKV